MQNEISNIIRQMKEVQEGTLWMGKNFESRLKDIDERTAFIQPVEDMHSVVELLSHLTAWRKDAIIKMKTGTGFLTEDKKENWMPLEELKNKGWKAIVAEDKKSLQQIIDFLADKNDDFLEGAYYDNDYKGKYSMRFLLEGLLHHDIYHLGQLGITIKYLLKNKAS